MISELTEEYRDSVWSLLSDDEGELFATYKWDGFFNRWLMRRARDVSWYPSSWVGNPRSVPGYHFEKDDNHDPLPKVEPSATTVSADDLSLAADIIERHSAAIGWAPTGEWTPSQLRDDAMAVKKKAERSKLVIQLAKDLAEVFEDQNWLTSQAFYNNMANSLIEKGWTNS